MVAGGRLSSTAARTVFDDMLKSGDDPDAIAKKLDLHQLGDEAEIEKIVTGVILQNPKVAADIRAGQEKAIGYLVGQVMTKTQGKANPAVAQRIIRKQLDLNDL